MKTIKLILVLFILIFTNFLYAANDDALVLLKKANKLYQEQNYEEALTYYENILHKGLESSELYYNLGNTYYRLGRLGYAVLNYERALKLSPSDEDIKYNLRIANAHSIDKIEEIPQVFFVEWWNALVMSFTINGWAVFVIIVFIMFITLIGLYYYYRNSNLQKPLFFTGAANLAVLIIIALLFVTRISHETSNEYGVLLENTANVKVSPDDNSNDAFIIHEGIKFVIEDKVNNWTKIKLNDGKVGWLNNNYFKTI